MRDLKVGSVYRDERGRLWLAISTRRLGRVRRSGKAIAPFDGLEAEELPGASVGSLVRRWRIKNGKHCP